MRILVRALAFSLISLAYVASSNYSYDGLNLPSGNVQVPSTPPSQYNTSSPLDPLEPLPQADLFSITPCKNLPKTGDVYKDFDNYHKCFMETMGNAKFPQYRIISEIGNMAFFWPSEHDKKYTAKELFDRIKNSVFYVEATRGKQVRVGSAVAIQPDKLLTNCHVVMWQSQAREAHDPSAQFDIEADQIIIRGHDPEKGLSNLTNATILLHDCNIDIAVLQLLHPVMVNWPSLNYTVQGITINPIVVIRSFKSINVGETVYALGNPAGMSFTFSRGIVSQVRPNFPMGQSMPRVNVVQTDASISTGSSGGGLFDEYGNFIGVTESILVGNGIENVNFAVAADELWLADR